MRLEERISIRQARQGAAGEVSLAGRILARDAAGRVLLLADASGRIEVRLAPELRPEEPGSWVAVSGELRTGERGPWLRAGELRLLTPHRGTDPFPSPGGEYHRLHGGVPSRAQHLVQRGRILAGIRAFFAARDYLEVQPPHLVRLPGMEPHLCPLPAADGYLITSPEYHLKRLLAGGLERIYAMGPCWRGDELGPHHLREFTMLEWYRALGDLDSLMAETEALVHELALAASGGPQLRLGERTLHCTPPWPRLTVAEACQRFAGVDLAGATDATEARQRAEAAGLGPFAADAPFEEVLSRILVERVEPRLAELPTPVFLHRFPAPLAALSRLDPADPTVALRFELYAGGLELANAFDELTDPDEQRARLEAERAQRRAEGAADYPLDERLIAALAEGLPPTAGIALGVDRLVMLLCGAEHIGEVVAFAPDEV